MVISQISQILLSKPGNWHWCRTSNSKPYWDHFSHVHCVYVYTCVVLWTFYHIYTFQVYIHTRTYICIYIHTYKCRYRKGELRSKRKRRNREVFHLLVHSPNAPSTRDGPGQSRETGAIRVSHMGTSAQGLRPCSTAFPDVFAGSLIVNGASRTQAGCQYGKLSLQAAI